MISLSMPVIVSHGAKQDRHMGCSTPHGSVSARGERAAHTKSNASRSIRRPADVFPHPAETPPSAAAWCRSTAHISLAFYVHTR